MLNTCGMMSEDAAVRKFADLMRVPVTFYKSIGEDLYAHRSANPIGSLLLRIYMIVGFVNFNVLVIGEIVFFVKALQDYNTIKLAIAVAPCIGFSFVADIKQFALVQHKQKMTMLLDDLERMFPATRAAQTHYRLEQYFNSTKRALYGISFLCLAYTTTFSFYPAIKGAVKYNLLGSPTFERNFGFLILFPYDATGTNLAYWLTYSIIAHGAYLAGVAFLCADLVLIVSITQLCMHFDFISLQLESYACDASQGNENMRFLGRIIVYHEKCLTLCEHVNNIFNTSLLLNFLTASMQICFIAFQVTETTVEGLLIYGIFLTTSLVQVLMVCYYSDELIEAGLRVGDAAFNQKWFQCNATYQRVLVLLIKRSQKPPSIRPPTFPPVSLRTFMKVISMSYQFFALLRTTYYKN